MGEVLHEKCAVVGVADASGEQRLAAALTHMGLFTLQHRGTESSGIVSSNDGGYLQKHHGFGLVKDVYAIDDLMKLEGDVAVGQNRYATNGGKKDKKYIQPFWYLSTGISFGHNGNLPDTDRLEQHLRQRRVRTEDMNDSRMMGALINENIRVADDVLGAVAQSTEFFDGAYSCVTSHDGWLVGFRDPFGIRPLAIGRLDNAYVIASESCALDTMNAEFVREVEPGEIVATDGKQIISKRFAEATPKLDMFEFVYFARPDSVLNGKVVDQVRRNFGKTLAEQFSPNANRADNVVVVPVPATSVPVAEAYAEAHGIPMRSAIVKSSYVGRTFIAPEQQVREVELSLKHNLMEHLIKGKDVIFVDDSIVRLNTIPALVRRARELGARTVSVLISSPPVRFPDYYGIDTPLQADLAAANMTVEEMRRQIEGNRLGFLSVSQTVEATGLPFSSFNLSPFTGHYPIPIGKNQYEIYSPASMEYVD